jgi:hypothetical protein
MMSDILRLYMNAPQRAFLHKNGHLHPVGRLDAGTVIVRDDEAKNEFGERPAYVLTSDCKVQTLDTFVANFVVKFIDEPI